MSINLGPAKQDPFNIKQVPVCLDKSCIVEAIQLWLEHNYIYDHHDKIILEITNASGHREDPLNLTAQCYLFKSPKE